MYFLSIVMFYYSLNDFEDCWISMDNLGLNFEVSVAYCGMFRKFPCKVSIEKLSPEFSCCYLLDE